MIRSFLVLLHDLKTLQNIRLTERSRCGAANIWCWNLVLVIALRWPWALLCALAAFWVDDVFNGKGRTELGLSGSHFKKVFWSLNLFVTRRRMYWWATVCYDLSMIFVGPLRPWFLTNGAIARPRSCATFELQIFASIVFDPRRRGSDEEATANNKRNG